MTPTPRQTRREKRLRSIKDAALELVVEDGIDGFSVHKLADRVDLTPGALYRYFESRDDMLIAVQAEVLEVFDRYLELVQTATETRPALEQIVVACRAYLTLADLQPERFRLNAQFVSTPRPVFDANKVMETALRTVAMLDRLASRIQKAQDDELFRPGNAQHRAVIAWSSLHALVERQKLERLAPEAFNSAALVDELLLTLLVGWGADVESARTVVDQKVSMDMLHAAMEAAENKKVD